MLKTKPGSQKAAEEARAGRGTPQFFRKIKSASFSKYAKETAFGKYLLNEGEIIRGTKAYERYLEAKNAVLSEESALVITFKRTLPFINAYYSWRYASRIRKTNRSLMRSAAFFEESMRHFKREDAEQKIALMGEAVGKAKRGVVSAMAAMALASCQALWLAGDMLRSFIQAPPAMGFFQKVAEMFKDTATGTIEMIAGAASIAVMMGIHYAFYMMERARKRELLAQDRAFLTDSELDELTEIIVRQKKRADSLKGHEQEKNGLKRMYEQVQDESMERRRLECYAKLEKAKKAMIAGNEAIFRVHMQSFIGGLMWHGKFARIEIVAHAAGMNGPDVAEIAKAQIVAALVEKKAEIAANINHEYGCFSAEKFASLLDGATRV